MTGTKKPFVERRARTVSMSARPTRRMRGASWEKARAWSLKITPAPMTPAPKVRCDIENPTERFESEMGRAACGRRSRGSDSTEQQKSNARGAKERWLDLLSAGPRKL